MRNVFAVAAAACISIAACAAAPAALDRQTAAGDEQTEALPENFFSTQNACSSEWLKVVQDWKSSGGGIRSSLADTRRDSIAKNTSKFAGSVRQAWELQHRESGAGKPLPFGAWPIDDARYREVMASTLDAFRGVVSTDCRSVTWLGPLLWDEVRVPGKAEVLSSRVSDLPRDVAKDPTSATQWLVYWIFSEE